ncbi:MAG: PfkB family carbohydrate kinase, partial [Pseudorhizobium sp.]
LMAARARSVTTILNTAPLTDEAARLARLADVVVANETEFELLAGRSDLDATAREDVLMQLHRETGQTYVVTLGADGVIAACDGALHRAKGLKIEPVDTVGAGDTFCGTLAAAIDSGIAFGQALRRAAVAGSLACLKPGAQPSIPTKAEVEDRLQG